MKITSLDIERFGLWTELHLSKMESGLNVFYGPNEAGKTTLMDFVRSILYGLHEERLRYVFPCGLEKNRKKKDEKSGEPGERRKKEKWICGGSLSVLSPDGHYRIQRMFDPHDLHLGSDEGLTITSENAILQDSAILRTILSGIDEPTFNNVFTFGLDELRKLGTLDDTAAAEMLFRLSIGLDRVSLVDVLRSLTKSRTALLDPQGSQEDLLRQLLKQRTKLTEELGQSRAQIWEYSRILTEQRKLDRIISQLREELEALRYEERIHEIAIHAAPIWDRRANLREQITAMGTPVLVPEETLLEVDEVQDSIRKKRGQFHELKEKYFDFRTKIAQTPVNEVLWKLAPRIEIVLEEEGRIIELDQQITELENEASALEIELREQEKHLRYGRRKSGSKYPDIDYHPVSFPGNTGSSGKNPGTNAPNYYAPQLHSGTPAEGENVNSERSGSREGQPGDLFSGASSQRSAQHTREMQNQPAPEPLRGLEEFRVYSRQVKRTRLRYKRSKQSFEELSERLNVLNEAIKSEMSKRDTNDLHEALERTGEMVSQLRRRHAIAQRLDEMSQYRKDLDRQNVFLIQNQAVPPWALVALIAAAIITIVLVVASVLNSEQFHPAFGGLGILAVVGGWGVKIMIERQNAQKLEHNQRQLSLLVTQIEQAKQDAAAIDARFPSTGISGELRLQNAQKDLAVLEKLIPIDAQRKEAAHQIKTEEERLARAKELVQRSQKNWSDWLASVSLPSDWGPQQIRDLIGRFGNAGEIRRNLDRAYEDINQRVRDLRIITDRIDRVVAETNLVFADGLSYVEVLAQIRKELIASEEGSKRRKSLAAEMKKLKPQRRKIRGAISALRVRRMELLRKYGAKSREELLQLARLREEYDLLLEQERTVQRELDAAIGGFGSEETIATHLEPETRKNLEIRKEQILRRVESTEIHLREEMEKHGRFGLELQQLAEDRSALRKRRELAVLNEKIKESVHSWRVQAVSCRILEDIRKAYERERQPLALAETSDYFRRLSSGRYQRVWTPLGEDTLKIDDTDSNILDVSWLSRGTREQLFISLRLALSASFARHGSDLPLILDDVMVNFDTQRAKAAAKVLEEFADSGKQIILFTCHEHISRIFQRMDVPVRILPKFEEKKKTVRVLLPISMVRRRHREEFEEESENSPENTDFESSLEVLEEEDFSPEGDGEEYEDFDDSSGEEEEEGDEDNDPFVQEFFPDPEKDEDQP